MQALVETQIKPFYETQRFTLFCGDCRSVLPTLDACSVDAIVTDPPAGISFMGKDWDHHKGGRDAWVAWLTEVMRECLRVLKPGGHALVWAIPRTSHWTGWAIESAGFEVRDRVSHLFGSGFPKSLDISKQLDAMAGAERDVVGPSLAARPNAPSHTVVARGEFSGRAVVTVATTDAAKQWQGWGTALKPACEDWWLCRKPIEGTVAQNVLRHGTGGLNIDGCRIAAPDGKPVFVNGVERARDRSSCDTGGSNRTGEITAEGRWPANVITDGSDEALALFPITNGSRASMRGTMGKSPFSGIDGSGRNPLSDSLRGHDDSGGSAARFFYCAKADQVDRNEGCEDLSPQYVRRDDGQPYGTNTSTHRPDGSERKPVPPRSNHHPTVKPTELMRYLCRLITPPGGIVLDPFTGSGSTGKAAMLEGLRFIGIELSEDYCQLAQRRIEAVTKQGMLFT